MLPFEMSFNALPNSSRYRRLERTKLEKGKPPKATKMPQKRAESQPSSAPPENENVLFPERNWGASGVYCEVADI
jgi:hypothetical protein